MLDLAGKRVTVMGLGRFGGGVGVTRFLSQRGADVVVTDLEPEERLADSVAAIEHLIRSGQVTLRLGWHNVSDFTSCDLVIANPAVPKPWDNRFLRSADAAGVPISTEIGLSCSMLSARARRGELRCIAVTGSAGKSTTSAMIHHALSGLRDSGVLGPYARVALGGNIGGSLLGEIDELPSGSWVVLELSSFMLWWMSTAKTGNVAGTGAVGSGSAEAVEFRRAVGARALDKGVGLDVGTTSESAAALDLPGCVALVTNISANHLDWHTDFEHYAASKQVLVRAVRDAERAAERAVPGAVVLVDPSVRGWRSLARARVIEPDLDSWRPPSPRLSLPGDHNRVNAIGALEACVAALGEAHREMLAERIATFTGLEHRLQRVGEYRGVVYFNDSKSTTPESALMALTAVGSTLSHGQRGVHLIAGGYDKQIDLSSLADAAKAIACLYTIGDTGPVLAALARAAGASVVECGTLVRAFDAARSAAKPGDAVLLSPACASWDQYVNFEARGDEFVRLFESLDV